MSHASINSVNSRRRGWDVIKNELAVVHITRCNLRRQSLSIVSKLLLLFQTRASYFIHEIKRQTVMTWKWKRVEETRNWFKSGTNAGRSEEQWQFIWRALPLPCSEWKAKVSPSSRFNVVVVHKCSVAPWSQRSRSAARSSLIFLFFPPPHQRCIKTSCRNS